MRQPRRDSPSQPISEQYRLAALRWADLDNAARLLEDGKTIVLAKWKGETGETADSRAETQVKSSERWADYIRKMNAARTAALRAKIEVEFLKMRFSEWQSADANARAERRM